MQRWSHAATRILLFELLSANKEFTPVAMRTRETER